MKPLTYKLKDKVAIVTGSSKGIGAEIAKAFADQKAKVVVSSRNQAAVDQIAGEIIAAGGTVMAKACHVGHPKELEALVNFTLEHFGSIDILVNNAATNPVYGKLSEASSEVFDKIMNVNVKACWTLANLCYPHMVARGGGSVINIASVEGLKPSSGLGLYSVSKAALIMLTKSQAKEWGHKNIRSNAICPGLIQTKFSQSIWQDEKTLQQFTQMIPMPRMAQPKEMSGLATFLASEDSSYVTGGVYTADGGYMIA